MEYAELTSPEAGELQAGGAVLILPVGSTEQHGHALPLATDTVRAELVARRVAARFAPGEVAVLPTLAYGISPHHRRLPGTLTLPPRLYCELVVSLCEAMADTGWRKLLVVNGHGGNNAALTLVQQELLASRPDFRFAWTPISRLAGAATARLTRSEVTGHSGESETAQLLALREDLVRRDRLAPGATTLDGLDPAARLSRDPGPSLAVPFDEYHPSGVLGDPRGVTAEQGEEIIDEAVGAIAGFLRHLIAL